MFCCMPEAVDAVAAALLLLLIISVYFCLCLLSISVTVTRVLIEVWQILKLRQIINYLVNQRD